MPAPWQTVRVSSVFRDMHAERDWLVKRVFPALRERPEQHRVHLVDVDLRQIASHAAPQTLRPPCFVP